MLDLCETIRKKKNDKVSRYDLKKALFSHNPMSRFGEEQLQFFETWLKIVFDEAVHVSPEGGAWGG